MVNGIVSITPPPGCTNCVVPVSASSVGLINVASVVQLPPLAKCGITAVAPVGTGCERSTTGSAVIRKSDRSLINVLSAVTATGTDDVNVSVPANEAPTLKGASLTNLAV